MLKHRFLPGAVSLFLATSISAAEPPKTVRVRAAWLLDVRSGQMKEGPVVTVEGNRISKVEFAPSRRETPEQGAIDLSGLTLLPGLIDAHTHVLLQGDATSKEYEDQILKEAFPHRVARAVRAAKISLEHGFTTIRDLETEGAFDADAALRDAIAEGVIPGPRMKVVTRALSTT